MSKSHFLTVVATDRWCCISSSLYLYLYLYFQTYARLEVAWRCLITQIWIILRVFCSPGQCWMLQPLDQVDQRPHQNLTQHRHRWSLWLLHPGLSCGSDTLFFTRPLQPFDDSDFRCSGLSDASDLTVCRSHLFTSQLVYHQVFTDDPVALSEGSLTQPAIGHVSFLRNHSEWPKGLGRAPGPPFALGPPQRGWYSLTQPIFTRPPCSRNNMFTCDVSKLLKGRRRKNTARKSSLGRSKHL